jgi:hypothetical protein
MQKFLLLLFTFCIYFSVSAQNTFEKIIDTLGTASAACIQETFDGGYVFCGVSIYNNNDAVIVKLDSIGTIEWAKLYGGPGMEGAMYIEQTPDSGYMVNAAYDVGLYSKAWLMRLDTNGDTLWTKTYSVGNGGTEVVGSHSMASINNFIYAAAGYFTPQFPAPLAPYLIITYSNGSVLASKIYSFSPYGSAGQAICKSYDNNGFAITGQHGVAPLNTDINLIRTDVVGDTLWTRTYDYSYAEQAFAIAPTTDSGFIIAGITWNSTEFKYNIYLIKTDIVGDTLWTKMYYSSESQVPTSIQQTDDGGFIILGNAPNGFAPNGAPNADLYLIKTDAFGDTLWTRFYGNIANDYGRFVRQTKDGGYIIGGGGGVLGAAGAYIIKTDSMGNVSSGTGMAEINNPFVFNVYPNPAKELLNVQLKGLNKSVSQIELYNTNSQLVFSSKVKNNSTHQIDISRLPDGLYAIILRLNNQIFAKKIIINK